MRVPVIVAVVLLLGGGARADGPERVETDLLIVGGTESGCAAAVQAARMGVRSITLVNDIAWLGGQFSAEGLVAIDENRGPEGYGHGVPFPRAGLFKEVIDRIEAVNLGKYGRARPGNTRVITTCRPADAEQAFRDLVRPYVERGQLRILSHYHPVGAKVEAGTLREVRFRPTREGGADLVVAARLTIDASDWGDVIKAAGAEYEFGPDVKGKYGEPLAPTEADAYPATDMNPITYCMVIVETDRYEPIPKPEGYDPRLYTNHPYPKDPLWLYASRRVIDHYGFKEVKGPDVVLLCFPVIDYPLDVLPGRVAEALEATEKGASRKNIVQLSREQRQIIFDDAKRHSLGFLYHLQTAVHEQMQDKTHSFRRFVLSDEFGTPDRMPFKPYVRESLRLKAMYMMRQQDTTGHGGKATHFATAMYHDGVACWQFEYDFHPTGRRFPDGDPSGPWVNYFRKGRRWGPPYSGRSLFPVRSLVPAKVDGLLGAQKNLGYSSLVSAAVRLHDQSMAVGQAAGAVAATSLRHGAAPRALPWDRKLLSEVWRGLCTRKEGAEPVILWPFGDVAPDHPAFEAVNLLAIHRCLPLGPREVDFRPDQSATEAWKQAVAERTGAALQGELPTPPRGEMTRGEFCRRWWAKVGILSPRAYERKKEADADGDGIPDRDDPLPLEPGTSSWAGHRIPADEDGNPDPMEKSPGQVRLFHFAGKGVTADGFVADHGLPFEEGRGHGWRRDISASQRRRGLIDGAWRDAFLFTRGHDVWECAVENGVYTVTVCVGDAGHAQEGQNVTVEGKEVLRDHATEAGLFAERTVAVEVADGRLTVEIGRKGGTTNTCLCWVRLARK